jgi:hypothetical protein
MFERGQRGPSHKAAQQHMNNAFMDNSPARNKYNTKFSEEGFSKSSAHILFSQAYTLVINSTAATTRQISATNKVNWVHCKFVSGGASYTFPFK